MSGKIPSSECSVYIHVPFCTKKCPYCHFYVIPNRDDSKKQLLDGLQLEWKLHLPKLRNFCIRSIYFGGGTPSLFGPDAIGSLIAMIRHSFIAIADDVEITLEVNPENASETLLKQFFSVGVNRISIGVQSFDDKLLKQLGRTHHAEDAAQAIVAAEKAGFTNISLDLMYDVPTQSIESWRATLGCALKLPITHCSIYNLTIEPQTVFFKFKDTLQKTIPSPEDSLKMYEMTRQHFQESTFEQYEISAFCKSGFRSIHNSGYWSARPFIGMGPSAFSFWERKRFRNVANLSQYCKALHLGTSPVDFEEQLNDNKSKRELLAIGLRLLNGVDMSAFGAIDVELDQDIQSLVRDGFLEYVEPHLKLTKKGVLFYDTVASVIV